MAEVPAEAFPAAPAVDSQADQAVVERAAWSDLPAKAVPVGSAVLPAEALAEIKADLPAVAVQPQVALPSRIFE